VEVEGEGACKLPGLKEKVGSGGATLSFVASKDARAGN
jgi:hypothetical protein